MKQLNKEDLDRLKFHVKNGIFRQSEEICNSVYTYSTQYCWSIYEGIREDFELLSKLDDLLEKE